MIGNTVHRLSERMTTNCLEMCKNCESYGELTSFHSLHCSPIQNTISLSRHLFRILIKLYAFQRRYYCTVLLCNFSSLYLILKAFQFIFLVLKHKNQFWLKALQSYIALLNTFWSLEGLLSVKFLSNFLQH